MSVMSALHTRGFTYLVCYTASDDVVCPAHAGIHPTARFPSDPSGCLPCTRGDSPLMDGITCAAHASALHTRGFTSDAGGKMLGVAVCPAHAGIHPPEKIALQYHLESALHTRGFTVYCSGHSRGGCVCPAHAGIHPSGVGQMCDKMGLPCTRGDSPAYLLAVRYRGSSALHTRGFTSTQGGCVGIADVCPAHAGIHLNTGRLCGHCGCLPCTRGDSPHHPDRPPGGPLSALHTRGFTLHEGIGAQVAMVCPAHAGIHPQVLLLHHESPGLPCTRGDSPRQEQAEQLLALSALHTRGFTFTRASEVAVKIVCPAHAGIHRGRTCRTWGQCRLPCTRGDSPLPDGSRR